MAVMAQGHCSESMKKDDRHNTWKRYWEAKWRFGHDLSQ